jgi:hypothetical protein
VGELSNHITFKTVEQHQDLKIIVVKTKGRLIYFLDRLCDGFCEASHNPVKKSKKKGKYFCRVEQVSSILNSSCIYAGVIMFGFAFCTHLTSGTRAIGSHGCVGYHRRR